MVLRGSCRVLPQPLAQLSRVAMHVPRITQHGMRITQQSVVFLSTR